MAKFNIYMKYYEIEFSLSPCTQDAQDILAAMAGEAGCESFEETPTGLKAYVQQSLYDETALNSVVENFPFGNTSIIYKVCEAEDRDWNEQWEQEGFEPIIIRGEEKRGGRKEERGERYDSIVIHDGRHLPPPPSRDTLRPSQDTPLSPLSPLLSPLFIEIDAHLAFGTGTHETTRMICGTLLSMDLTGWRVLDCGSGTGILGICALKLGAAHCTAYDIDEWSVDNTRHNAVINHVDSRLTPLHGDASVLSGSAAGCSERFDLVMANINRNVLLQDMARFRQVMADGATLIISGFYQNDCAPLESRAQQLGLTAVSVRHDGDWACLVFHS